MRSHDQQGTSFKENLSMLMDEIRKFPKGRIFHKLLNIGVEAARAYPKITVFIILGLVVTGLEWWLTGNFW